MNRPLRTRVTALLATSTLATSTLAVLSLAAAGPAAAADRGAQVHDGPCRNGYVGLTYDDGPSASTGDLLTALSNSRLRATMFNQGNNALARPELVRAELRAGMWVGNHTFSHPHLTQIGEPAAFQEIASTQWVL